MSEANINIEEIIEEIRSNIKEKGLENDIPSMSEALSLDISYPKAADFNAVQRELDFLKGHRINYYRNPKSSIKIFTPIVKLIKKIIMKSVRFVVEPMSVEINDHNTHVIKAFEKTMTSLNRLNSAITSERGSALGEERKYKQLSEQYATSYYQMSEQIETLRKAADTTELLQTQIAILSKKLEKQELEIEVLRLKLQSSVHE